MTGFYWITTIWLLTVYAFYLYHVRRRDGWPLSPLVTRCLVLLLFGSVSGGAAGAGIGLSTVIRGFLAAAALVFAVRALLINSAEGRIRAAGRRTNILLLSGYAAAAVISVTYSVAPLQTAGKAFEIGVAVLVVWAVATSPNAEQQIRVAVELIIMMWMATLAVAMVGFFVLPSQFVQVIDGRPGFVFPSSMGAPYSHSNGLSALGAMVAAYAVARAVTARTAGPKRWWIGVTILSSVAILLASGRQGVIIWAIAVGIVLFLYARAVFVFALIPAVGFALVQWSAPLWAAITRNQQEAQLYTLTGRLGFWEGAIEVWRDNPLIGYGFGVGGKFVALPSIGQDAIGSLHNGYFEALVGVGLVGTVPLAIVVLRVARWSWIRLQRGVEPHLAILIIPLAMHTAVSLGFAAWLTSQFVVLALVGAYADLAPEPRRRHRALIERRSHIESRHPATFKTTEPASSRTH